MRAKTLMVLGSMSSAGKSLLVTGLCRLYARRGWQVLPFKAQNMSNNAAVCAGGEIGRAQAVQAYAAGVEPTVDMNPILLKPEADARSQVVLRGQVWGTLEASDYYPKKHLFWKTVTQSLDNLLQEAELVIMEGAGSPAELNLRDHDLVNLSIARYAQAPCLLVGDIDRGGIFAQLLGTLWLLEQTEQDCIKAFVVNKFRGDMNLFRDGVQILEKCGGKPVLGVIPYLKNHGVPDEDAASIPNGLPVKDDLLDMVVIHLPHISNFDDFDSLRFEPGVHLRFACSPQQLGWPQVIFLPGTKNTLGDLQWLYQSGLAELIKKFADRGARVIGFCGGFQMLGNEVMDEHHLESDISSLPGLGLLPMRTCLAPEKLVTRSEARVISDCGFFKNLTDCTLDGYEIHLGRSECSFPLLEVISRENQPTSAVDGTCSADGKIWGCHLHGLLDNDRLRAAWLESLGVIPASLPFKQLRQQAYDHLADVLEASLDISRLDKIIEAGV